MVGEDRFNLAKCELSIEQNRAWRQVIGGISCEGRGEGGQRGGRLKVRRGSSTTVSDTPQQCTQAGVGVCHKPLPPSLTPELRGDEREAERENTTAQQT